MRHGCQQRHILDRVAGIVAQVLGIGPVIDHFVVVPLPHLRNLGVEAAEIGVQQVVLVATAELVQGLGHLGDLGGHQIGPYLAVFGGLARFDRAVGIDAIATMDEKMRLDPAHGLINPHAAKGLVDAPALACRIATPEEADVFAFAQGMEVADDRFALGAAVA
jgi:hypothetical protein